ncbi:PadR family transcriptional regulator [Streptomyces sp. SAJ15]|uniref:PadR family transcriptional regulator n=1 Tax=Streptomyces sp. SAJ15 TaxID=2011095 RepID=UPI00118669CA|nr:PadR family transcriptional regulator [Streptomyces sp. SAJ15]TVL94087.1 PadR family transcriptional regulator [Streptomyces sp. SAJ15]
MSPVFAHGRLRLYLLKLLDEAPRHGYEVIRLLEERFHGMYAPSAGTVYPRLAKLEAEGLVSHTTEGGRKVYATTDAGRAELADRSGELAELEVEIRESVAELAAEIREDVRDSASDLRREMREAARRTRTGPDAADVPTGEWDRGVPDHEAWRAAEEEMRHAKDEWREQARRAKEESRRARQDAQRARRQARAAEEQAREELQAFARRLQEQTQEHLRSGDWQRAVREGLAEVSRGLGRLSRQEPDPAPTDRGPDGGESRTTGRGPKAAEERDRTAESSGSTGPAGSAGSKRAAEPAGAADPERRVEPEWSREFRTTGDPARDLDRLLDRFRDDIRDTARDHTVSEDTVAEARRRLAETAAGINALLRRAGRD